jgi:hypothetical protein
MLKVFQVYSHKTQKKLHFLNFFKKQIISKLVYNYLLEFDQNIKNHLPSILFTLYLKF